MIQVTTTQIDASYFPIISIKLRDKVIHKFQGPRGFVSGDDAIYHAKSVLTTLLEGIEIQLNDDGWDQLL